MSDLLIKPYEISVWGEELVTSGNTSYIQEKKLVVIGSDTMTGPNKVYEPVFNKKTNGEKTLTFSLKYKYFDYLSGNEEVINPFANLLVNERKVKLKYDGEWHEFIIKDHTESSEDFTWTYTCTDAFILELSKTGYNLTFDAELNNNQGTAYELAREVVKDTDWQIVDPDPDSLKQLIEEPLYKAELVDFSASYQQEPNVIIINTDTDEPITLSGPIFVFYSYVNNKNGKYVQFIRRDTSANPTYVTDEKNVIISTNFRIKAYKDSEHTIETDLVYKTLIVNDEPITGFWYWNDNIENYQVIIKIQGIEEFYQGYRLSYKQRTTYDSITGHIVDISVSNTGQTIYHYQEPLYTTSGVISNFITNGENFDVLEDSSIQGWREANEKISLITNPEWGTTKPLMDLSALVGIDGFLKVDFTNSGSSHYVINTSFDDNLSAIGHVAQGDKFVFRWRARQALDETAAANNLRAEVFKRVYNGTSFNDISIIQFNGSPVVSNNIIDSGVFSGNNYLIDGAIQTPSTKYIYQEKNDNTVIQKIWDQGTSTYVNLNNNYTNCYYLIGTANRAITKADFTDPTTHYWTKIYVNDGGTQSVYIQDIQLTRYAQNEDGTPVLIGNIPTSTTEYRDYYYEKPESNQKAEDIAYFSEYDNLTPIYGEQKVLSINESQSNCFNILQSIAETFECWIDFKVSHDELGYIETINNIPQKFIYLREYVGKDNWAGFKYGINIESIERTINTEEFVTKLIVNQSQSDLVDTGYISIADAPSNPSGEANIYNFNYYYKQGLLNEQEVEADKTNFINDLNEINNNLKAKEKERRELESAVLELESKYNVYSEMLDEATEKEIESLNDFERLAGKTYSEYTIEHMSLEESKRLTEDKNFNEIIGNIYSYASVCNNYGGLLSNIEVEYKDKKVALEGNNNIIIRIWTEFDNLLNRHICLEANEYSEVVEFQIGDGEIETFEDSIDFDIEDSNSTILYLQVSDANYKIYHLGEEIQGTEVSCILRPNEKILDTYKIIPPNSSSGIIGVIDKLIEDKNKLINEFENKYSRFIQEGTWNSSEYLEPELYYLEALQVSNTSAQPTVDYSINVVEVSKLQELEGYQFDVGDKTYIEDTEFFGWHLINTGSELVPHWTHVPAREEVIVSEVEWHLDEPDQNVITVQNYKTRFEDLFQRINATVQTVQYNEATYAKISTLMDANGNLNQNVLLDSLSAIAGREYGLTSDGSIRIDGPNILIQDLTNSLNRVIINNRGIQLSSDGGNTWTEALSARGINIGAVYTGSLNTDQVVIGDENNPSFRWDKSGISAYELPSSNSNSDSNEGNASIEPDVIHTNSIRPLTRSLLGANNDSAPTTSGYNLNTFVRFDRFGLYGIKDLPTFIASSVEDVKAKAHFAVTWDGFFIKNNYEGGGRVEITSDNDFRVVRTENEVDHEKIKIGALEWYTNEYVETQDTSVVENKNYYIRSGEEGSYIYTEVLNPTGNPQINGWYEREITTNPNNGIGAPRKYGIRILNDAGAEVMKTTDDGNLIITGTIDALGANFSQMVTVGKNQDTTASWIEIDGVHSEIRNAYADSRPADWWINKDGDAVFNNITARGAIRTAVFEYAEIQAVGGIFFFRPSSTIRSATSLNGDLVLTVEKPALFNVGNWCKVSNYTSSLEPIDTLGNGGLSYVYKISNKSIIEGKTYITLENAATMIGGPITSEAELIGGALVDLGKAKNDEHYEGGIHNYGIGINSSDNTVNLPARAISLFETNITPAGYSEVLNPDSSANPSENGWYEFINDACSLTEDIQVDENKTYYEKTDLDIYYNYRGILGTLPPTNTTSISVDNNIYPYMEGKQGIYTDNMYIGDANRYVAFYKDGQNGHLKVQGDIKATALTIADESGASDVSYTVVVNTIDINYNNGTAILKATPYYQGGTILDTGLIYTWYQDNINDNNVIEYMKTRDTAIITGKEYYVYENDEYVLVLNPIVQDIGNYYEKVRNILNVNNLEHIYICVLSRNEGE